MHSRERLSTIHRNLVVSYDKGELIGHVTDVYFDKSSCGVKGLSIAPKRIQTERELFVGFKDIHRLGESVVIVSSRTDLKKAPEKLAGSSLKDLKKIKIVTEGGEHLGELLDVNVLAKSGVISDLILYGSKKLKIDVEKDKISIGPDMIIVPTGYQKRIEALADQERNRFFANAEKTTRSVTESIKSAVFGVTASKPNEAGEAPAKKKPSPAATKAVQPEAASKPSSGPSPATKKVAKKTATTPSKKTATTPPKKRPSKKAAKTAAKK